MKVAFLTNDLQTRGTQTTAWWFAFANKNILGNESVIFTFEHPHSPYASPDTTEESVAWFTDNYVTHFVTPQTLDEQMVKAGIDVCFAECYGTPTNLLPTSVPVLAHCVFDATHDIGTLRVAVSAFLARQSPGVEVLHNPVQIADHQLDFRTAYNIPQEATVFGRYGGFKTFDYAEVKEVVIQVAQHYPHIFFLFMNTEPFVGGIDNIIFVQGTRDDRVKRGFINTCDAMLHARQMGETFGCSCAEFAVCGKPVITTDCSRDLAHIELLGEAAIIYNSASSLHEILTTFSKRDTFCCGSARAELGGSSGARWLERSSVAKGQTKANLRPTTRTLSDVNGYNECTIEKLAPELHRFLRQSIQMHKTKT